jgi:predicted ribosomally synthesized peptide with SipW-like signal peptide
MKKIALSVGTIVFVGAAVAGVTGAFFNDIETSTGNVFVAGSIDLRVDSFGASYNGEDLEGTFFPARDLTDEHFFVFDDIKPGDYGTRNISIHAASNPAYACLFIRNKDDDDHDITDPEDEAATDLDDNDDGTSDGDLSRELSLFAWEDKDGSATYDPVSNGEPPLVHDGGSFAVDSFFDITYEIFFDSSSGLSALDPDGPPRHIGLWWCAGDMTVDHSTGAITCDGSGMGDVAQTDSFTADVTLYAEQVRNNPDFLCAEVNLDEEAD